MYASGAPAGGYVDGAYVTETYVGPISIVLGVLCLGFLCPLVFLCPVRATAGETRRRRDATTRRRDANETDDDAGTTSQCDSRTRFVPMAPTFGPGYDEYGRPVAVGYAHPQAYAQPQAYGQPTVVMQQAPPAAPYASASAGKGYYPTV